MTTPRRICLVSPSHVSANPRLVKEADALQEAGYDVHVVSGWYFPPLDPYDHEIFVRSSWKRTVVHYLTGPRVLWEKSRRNAARRRILNTPQPSLRLAIRSHHAAGRLLSRAAAKVPAEMFIGHTLAGLPAAAAAALARKARLGFDAEDFHSAETEQLASGGAETAAVRQIESHFLPHCLHFTAASPLIAEAYAQLYGIPAPEPVLNVFPLAEAPAAPVAPAAGPARLYWFSQTVGAGRGLEAMIGVLARMRTPCELHLRGIPAMDFSDRLRRLAREKGFRGDIHFLPSDSASEMARLAAPFDLGLSLEQPWPPNRDLCLTNKIFTYLLAGIPVALTSTHAQKKLAPELGEAALIVDLDHPDATAAGLDQFLSNPARRQAARDAAWKLAQTRFNWDREKFRFLESVARVFDSSNQRVETAAALARAAKSSSRG